MKPRMSASGAKGARREVSLVRIFLSSPGDVAEERAIARQFFDSELPKLAFLRGQLAIELIAWDDPAARIPMLATETPQESVNAARPRPAACDIVIVVLWSRMGTPLPESVRKPNGEPYLSGTEWEYEDAINSSRQPPPRVLVYRRTEEPKIGLSDPELADKLAQFQCIKAFFERFRNADGSLKSGVNEYETPSEFKTLLSQNVQDVIWRHLEPSNDDDKPTLLVPQIPADYAAYLRRNFGTVDLLGAKEGRAVTLDSVYVPALTRASPLPEPGEKTRKAELRAQAEEQQAIPLLQRLDEASLYVPAPAGAGKSTFCRWAALQSIADADMAHPVPAPDGFAEPLPAALRGRLTLLVPLRDFWRSMDCGRGERTWRRTDLQRALTAWIDASPPDGLTGELLLAHLVAGSALLLLDGLDEVQVLERRNEVSVYPRALLLSGLADALPLWEEAGNRILLTSRPYGLDEAGLHRLGLTKAPIEPLPTELQNLFVGRWFHTLGKPQKTRDLIATIRGRGDLAPLVDNPMLLTALCVLYDNGGRLPEDRYNLYKSMVDGVLHNRYADDAGERDPVERRLEAIAYGMHCGDGDTSRLTPVADISWIELERLLARFTKANPVYEREQVEAAVRREQLLNHSGLLVPKPNERAGFYHLSFQEFLAAQCIARSRDDLEHVFRERGAVDEWRSTLMFLFAAEIDILGAQWGSDLLKRLVNGQDRVTAKANPAPAVFIAEALELCLDKSYRIPDTLAETFRRLSQDAIEGEIEVRARQSLGLCLGHLGDPRIRSLRNSDAFIEVPAGTYPYGDDKRASVEIKVPFRLGRCPVTNSQYQELMDAGGYGDRRWWSEDGWTWLQAEGVTEPALWHDRRWNGRNQPVVGVSFWEAEACCAWAGGRLPSEQEWEAAARGPKGLKYPWGEDWEDGICNTREAGLGVTSPVGLFPRARQADLGIEDLAGNVWEWCASLYDPSKHNARVLRGGAWYLFQDGARAANRYWVSPYSRFNVIGFRVVCSSPSSGTDH